MLRIRASFVATVAFAAFHVASAADLNFARVHELTGLKGKLNEGDFAVTEDQLQYALKAMQAGGINILAIHSHMTHEQPRILFFHYWGRGPAKKLAEAVQGAALAAGLSGITTR